jgi:hypothetical protein
MKVILMKLGNFGSNREAIQSMGRKLSRSEDSAVKRRQ